MRRTNQIKQALSNRVTDRSVAWQVGVDCEFFYGDSLAWRLAWSNPPAYRREHQQFPTTVQERETVQPARDYYRAGGDCDDDVALLIDVLGGFPVFTPNEANAKHVYWSNGRYAIDRTPRAPRWRLIQ